jgi:hypothetical protein
MRLPDRQKLTLGLGFNELDRSLTKRLLSLELGNSVGLTQIEAVLLARLDLLHRHGVEYMDRSADPDDLDSTAEQATATPE